MGEGGGVCCPGFLIALPAFLPFAIFLLNIRGTQAPSLRSAKTSRNSLTSEDIIISEFK